MYKYIAVALLFCNTLIGVGSFSYSIDENQSFTPLYMAILECMDKSTRTAEKEIGALLQNGADPHQRIGELTILHVAVTAAATQGRYGSLVALLKNKVNPYEAGGCELSPAKMVKVLATTHDDAEVRARFQAADRLIESYKNKDKS